jgi:hypothetical protein
MLDSLTGRVDGVVLLDGPFQGVSMDITPRKGEQAAIAKTAGLEVVAMPGVVYPSEPVKRTVAARIAYSHWPEAEWLLGIDSDEELVSDIVEPARGQLGVAKILDPDWYTRRLCRRRPESCVSKTMPGGGEECDCPLIQDATMIRLHRLSADIAWGPSHFEVTNGGFRYATPHGLPSIPSCMVIKHHGVKKRGAMKRYNEQVRNGVEIEQDTAPTWSFASNPDTIYTGLA